MHTNGLGASLPRTAGPVPPAGVPGVRTTFPTRAPHAPVEQPSAPPDEPNSLRPPKGTDPELWKVLTSDERAFFAREDAMGPLSYGHRIANTPSLPARGGRLNLRG